MNGTVKWFDSKKGFGFIHGEDGADYFVPQSDILMDGFRALNKGDKVKFEVGVNEINGKTKAVNVKKVG